MLTLFQVCFFVGIGLILLSFVLGNLFDASGVDGVDFDLWGMDIFLPVNPMLYLLFATVFGGVGWILFMTYPSLMKILMLLIAIISGIIVSSMVSFLVIKPLKKAQNTSAPEEDELIGIRATVIETIAANGFGEISYVVKGNSFTAPAKSTNGDMIKVGKDVAICWIKEYVFYVVEMDDM